MNLTNFIWDQFPPHFEDNDTLQDAQGKGIFQRFLSVFGLELEEELVPKLEGLINEKDPNTSSDKFLSELAYSLGRPTDVLQNVDMYRTLLTQIISIYKIKGTKKSYELLFALLGLTATLVEHFPGENLYDTGLIYDDATEDAQLYDKTSCEVGCIDYSIEYSNIEGFGTGELTADQQQALRLMISDFIEPIDTSLRDLIYQVQVVEMTIINNTTRPLPYAYGGDRYTTIFDGTIQPGETYIAQFLVEGVALYFPENLPAITLEETINGSWGGTVNTGNGFGFAYEFAAQGGKEVTLTQV